MPTILATSSLLPLAPPTVTSANTATTGSLLPEASSDGMDDAMMTVDLLMAKQQSNDMQTGEAGAQVDKTARDEALAAQKAAIQKEQDNSASHGAGFFGSIAKVVKDASGDLVHGHIADAVEDTTSDVHAAVESPRFWSDLETGAKFVAEVAGVVAGAAATIATAGTAGPIVVGVALALSAGGFAVSETSCLDGILGKGVSQYVGLGLDLAGAAVTFGATAATTTTAATTAATTTASNGTAGAVRGASGGASVIGKVAAATSGAADVVAGGAHVKTADFAANVVDAEADETSAKDDAAKQERFTKWLLDNLSASQQAERDAMQTLQGAVQQRDAGTTAASSFTTRG
jgi:hypothetical protein